MRRALVVVLALLAAGPASAQEMLLTSTSDAPVSPWRVWARAEYLLWWVRDDHAPVPLATTGPAGVPRSGALGEPTTSVLIGPDIDYRYNSGGKLFLGGWFDEDATIGAEASGFCLETHTRHLKAYSDRTTGAPVIARPFDNLLTGLPDAQVITTPRDELGGRYLGGMGIFGDSRTWGAEANLLFNLTHGVQGRWDMVGGFRYLGQKDELRSDQSSIVLAPGSVGFAGRPAPAPDIVSVRDYLMTNNHFYGGQVGVQGSLQMSAWLFDAAAKVGLGDTTEHLDTTGRTLLTNSAGATLYRPGGLYVPTGPAHLDRGRLAFISEVNLRVGYRITDRWVASVGYTFLYWGDVIRPAGQINPAVDPRQVPSSLSYNPAVPPTPVSMHSTDFWAQGLTFGLEYRY
jgi:hypothetical protein